MSKLLTLDVTSIKFEDNETDLKFIASDKGIIVSDNSLSATIKIKQVDIGYLQSVSAKWVNNYLVISSSDLSNLPVGSYLLELWLGQSGGYEIYPDSGFVKLFIEQNATGIEGNVISSITLGEFQKQFSDLGEELRNNVADGIADTTADYTWSGTHAFNKKIITPAGIQGNTDTATKLQTARKIGGVSFDGTQDIDLAGVNKIGNQDTTGNAATADALNVRQATFTDFNDLAANLTKYQGLWHGGHDQIANSPEVGWYIINVIAWSSDTNLGYIILHYTDHNAIWFGLVASGAINWSRVSNDATVVHNTGSETVAGDKNFTGNNNFSGPTILQTGNYGLRVTTSGIQKTSDNGVTWTNI